VAFFKCDFKTPAQQELQALLTGAHALQATSLFGRLSNVVASGLQPGEFSADLHPPTGTLLYVRREGQMTAVFEIVGNQFTPGSILRILAVDQTYAAAMSKAKARC
jgi:hypothetical protein